MSFGVLGDLNWMDVCSQDELKTLASTPCDIPVLRNASLFSCLTGLRISDILNLKWENLCTAPDLGHCIRLRTQKTQTEALLPISYEAYALCGEPGTGKVFKELRRCMTGYPLKAWIKKAGIQKHITFHCLSHSKLFYLLNISELSILKNVTANDLETSYILFLSQLCNIQRTL